MRGQVPLSTSPRWLRQVYVAAAGSTTVRLREDGAEYWLTIKDRRSALTRVEIELPCPAEQGQALLQHYAGQGMVEKLRHRLRVGDHDWDVDVFSGANAGLILAEIELGIETERFIAPDWLGPEVTSDPRFTSHALARHPFSRWGVAYEQLLRA